MEAHAARPNHRGLGIDADLAGGPSHGLPLLTDQSRQKVSTRIPFFHWRSGWGFKRWDINAFESVLTRLFELGCSTKQPMDEHQMAQGVRAGARRPEQSRQLS